MVPLVTAFAICIAVRRIEIHAWQMIARHWKDIWDLVCPGREPGKSAVGTAAPRWAGVLHRCMCQEMPSKNLMTRWHAHINHYEVFGIEEYLSLQTFKGRDVLTLIQASLSFLRGLAHCDTLDTYAATIDPSRNYEVQGWPAAKLSKGRLRSLSKFSGEIERWLAAKFIKV